MRKYFFVSFLALLFCNINGQISLSFKTSNNLYLDKFHISGYKFVSPDLPANKIFIYNLNNTLFKTINIPATIYSKTAVMSVSENLFDLDAGVEYAVQTRTVTSTSSGNVFFYATYVFDETGSTLFFRDSGMVSQHSSSNILENNSGFFYDGTSVKMKVGIYGSGKCEFYNLPGSLPCAGCSSGIVNSISNGGGTEIISNEASFYPNPASDQLKLKYQLPPGWKTAKIKVYDINGKLVEDFNITDFFDFIYLPVDYNNGMYLYSLIVDDKIIKNEKIVLIK